MSEPHPFAVKRTELIWEGKYDADGRRVAPLRVALPFRTVETVNESAQDRQKALSLFESPGAYGGKDWRNRLIWGDKKYVLPSLLAEFGGKVNLIYIDPPFDTGADFSFTAHMPEAPDTEAFHAYDALAREPVPDNRPLDGNLLRDCPQLRIKSSKTGKSNYIETCRALKTQSTITRYRQCPRVSFRKGHNINVTARAHVRLIRTPITPRRFEAAFLAGLPLNLRAGEAGDPSSHRTPFHDRAGRHALLAVFEAP